MIQLIQKRIVFTRPFVRIQEASDFKKSIVAYGCLPLIMGTETIDKGDGIFKERTFVSQWVHKLYINLWLFELYFKWHIDVKKSKNL